MVARGDSVGKEPHEMGRERAQGGSMSCTGLCGREMKGLGGG